MSVLMSKNRQLKNDKKYQDYLSNLAKSTGIRFSSDLSCPNTGFPFLKYVINALILFCATYGSLNCIITAFELDMTTVPMFITCVIFALIFSFMYISYKAKIITYLFVFFSIIIAGTQSFSIINSGVSALRNNILIYIDNKVKLPFLREFPLMYMDQFAAMSVACCVIAVALMIILNIFISEKMSLLALVILTFPLIQFGMYFEFSSSKFSLFLVLVSWILVAAIQFSGGYDGLSTKMVGKAFSKKNRHYYKFGSDPKNVSRISVVWLCFIIFITGMVLVSFSDDNFQINVPTENLKPKTERVVKNFLSYGLGSMFSVEREGNEPGQLSNLSSLAFDGKTDLTVRMINYKVDRVYLRGFSGYDFNSNELRWEKGDRTDNDEQLFYFTSSLLKLDYEGNQMLCKSWHKISVKIEDNSIIYEPLNVPYYASNDNEGLKYNNSSEVNVKSGYHTVDNALTYCVYTIDNDFEKYPENSIDDSIKPVYDQLKNDAYDNALGIPEKNISSIKAFCDTYGISADDYDVVNKVISALEENYEYSLKPGKIPYGEDYINYFLNGSHKGYCEHFASAATLIFRYLGIPSRYAEGYVINRTDFSSGELVIGEKKEDWIETPYVVNKLPVDVSVPDTNRHAWVEIFKEGIGWVAVEATTAVSEDEDKTISIISAIFGSDNVFSSASSSIAERVNNINEEETKNGLIRFIELLICIAFGFYVIRMLYLVSKRHIYFKIGNNKQVLIYRYHRLYEIWQYFNDKSSLYLSYTEFWDSLIEKGIKNTSINDIDEFEKLIFSNQPVSNEQKKKYSKLFRNVSMQILVHTNFFKLSKFIFIDILW